MATVVISATASRRDTGAIQLLRGSHLLGRLNHDDLGGQKGAELSRLALAEAECERVYCEVEPGDVVIFHWSEHLLHSEHC